jgi:hypothetical protein
MKQTAWLVQRAMLAIVLMVGFSVFALAIAAGLLLIPYAEWYYLERVDFRIAVVCLGAGLAVWWAIVPRIDRFEPRGRGSKKRPPLPCFV